MAGSEAGFDKPSFSEHLAGLAPTLQQPAEKSGHYLSPEQLQLLEKLEYLTRYSPYIQIVLGVVGSGKSTLLNQFLPEQDNELITCRIEPETELSRQELINSIYTQLGQSIELPYTQQSPEETIYTTARQLHEDDRLLLVVVDDAENLDDGALTWLLGESRSNLPDGQHLRLVLFATPTLTQRLNSNRQLRETIEQHCHFLEIPAFDASAVRAYVEHNYGNLAHTLTDEQWDNIVTASAGLPGRIGAALERIDRPSSKKTPKTSNNFKWTAIIMLALFGLGLIAWLAPEYLLTEEESISVNLPIPAAETAPLSTREPVVVEPTPPEPPAEPLAESEPATEHTETVSDAQVAELMDSLKEETPASDETGADVSEAETPTTSGKLALQLPPLATQQDSAESAEKTAAPEAGSSSETTATPAAAKTSSTPETTTAKTATTKPEPAVTALSKPYLKEEQLLAWKPESYTLQMLGARQEKSVVEFIQSQSDYEKMYYFATEFKEKPWYVVVYGNYPDRQAAQAALRNLPAKLKQYKPWPRSAEGIQDDIHRVRP